LLRRFGLGNLGRYFRSLFYWNLKDYGLGLELVKYYGGLFLILGMELNVCFFKIKLQKIYN